MKAEGRLASRIGGIDRVEVRRKADSPPDRGEVERAKARRKAHSHLDPSVCEHLDPSVVGLQYRWTVVPEGIVWLIQ